MRNVWKSLVEYEIFVGNCEYHCGILYVCTELIILKLLKEKEDILV